MIRDPMYEAVEILNWKCSAVRGYPAGEGAGYAGGIYPAIDGIEVTQALALDLMSKQAS
ncbi:TPA: hypothetical protein QDB05_005450 [Burkholderia vietnamiensis]|uniref:hypothetical protein n=1 Tax=Burkholderia vietnamiensis TaxID=60552 RepID=UPI001B928254|nr:hypothetical protein [Burkholderia vietnamiensis]MBR8360952.1 hypothetical protein [Burkholderia vietnamiensis]HDR9158888.1 hypothetical protein [Burkholderia vietnamiensis]